MPFGSRFERFWLETLKDIKRSRGDSMLLGSLGIYWECWGTISPRKVTSRVMCLKILPATQLPKVEVHHVSLVGCLSIGVNKWSNAWLGRAEKYENSSVCLSMQIYTPSLITIELWYHLEWVMTMASFFTGLPWITRRREPKKTFLDDAPRLRQSAWIPCFDKSWRLDQRNHDSLLVTSGSPNFGHWKQLDLTLHVHHVL